MRKGRCTWEVGARERATTVEERKPNGQIWRELHGEREADG